MTSDKTISLPELLELRAKDQVELGRFVSVARRRARVEIVTRERSRVVTVVDPAP